MGRGPCCNKAGLKQGKWLAEEDEKLIKFIKEHDERTWNWSSLPKRAGLLRCGRGCRLRWMNYLRDDLKRGYFTPEEEETIFNLHDAFGNSWALIAAYFPGRSDNEIKNLWNYHLSRRVRHVFQDDGTFKTVLLRNLDHDNSKEKEEPPANRDKYKKKVEPPANGDMNKKKEEPPAKVSHANSSTAGEELIGLPADLVEWFDPREIAMMNDGLNEFGNLNEGESSESMEVAVEKMLWDLEPVELYPEPVHTDAPLDDTAVNMDSGIVQGNNEVTDAPLGDTAVNMESGIGQGNNEGTDATLGDTAVKMADSGTAQCNNEVTDASLGDTFVNMDSAIAQGNNDVTDTSVADITAFLERELGDHYEQLLESFCLVYETYVACL